MICKGAGLVRYLALQHQRELDSKEIIENIISVYGYRFHSSFWQLMCRNLEAHSGLCAHTIIKLLMEVKTTRVEPRLCILLRAF